jgi:deoxyribodipyrimidine photo-lyase
LAEPSLLPILMWFRRDFRLADNPALAHAAATGAPVIPLYIRDDALEGRPIGAAARWWLDKSLAALASSLDGLGSRLILRRDDSAAALKALIVETGARQVVFNRLHEPDAVARDERLVADLQRLGVTARAFTANLLAEPGAVVTGSGFPYKVFTPFFRALRPRLEAPRLLPRPRRLPAPDTWPASETLADWGLHPRAPDWSSGFAGWRPGEVGAFQALDGFIDARLNAYPAARDAPGMEGTSRLSPHLHWGEISPWRVVASAQDAARRGEVVDSAAEKLIAEVAWREFNQHLLAAFPALPSRSFDPRFERFPWRDDRAGLEAWRRGQTGYPIVDAGMRQLWATGWMHNRARMVAASFLVKHLLIDWREGEAWFWDTLVDADLANNAGNWQWVAGSGADAAPYFRIFSPEAQGLKFDADGAYVRRWVPELSALPDRWLHAPCKAPAAVLQRAGVGLGQTYPHPIVDHAQARSRALAAFRSLQTGVIGFDATPQREA